MPPKKKSVSNPSNAATPSLSKTKSAPGQNKGKTKSSKPLSKKDLEALKHKVAAISDALSALYPKAAVQLKHNSGFELLIATILSAQCTDERINKVTPNLFQRFPTPQAFIEGDQEEVIELIRSTGFFNNKAKSIMGASKKIVEDFNGEIPQTMEEMITLPGVARKTANVVLGNYYNKIYGIAVDTHVHRLSNRLGLSDKKDAVKVEADLMQIVPKEKWTDFSNELIWHGRRVCNARKPLCQECPITNLCQYYEETTK